MYSKLTPVRPEALNPAGDSFADPFGWTDKCTSGTGPVTAEVVLDYDTGESTLPYFAVSLTANTAYTIYGVSTYSRARIDLYDSEGTKVAYNAGSYTEPDMEWTVSDCVYTPTVSGVYIFNVQDGSDMGEGNATYDVYVSPRPSTYTLLGPTPYEKSVGFLADGSVHRRKSAFDAGIGPNMPASGLMLHIPMHDSAAYAETGQALTYQDIAFVDDAAMGVKVATRTSEYSPAYIRVADAASMPDGTAPRTISIWLKGTLEYQIIFAGITMSGTNGKIEVITAADSSTSVIFDYALTANTWQHIAYTYDGSALVLYVDGLPVATGTAASIARQNPLKAFADSDQYDGSLVSARIYSSALAQWAIQRLASEYTVVS